MAEAKHASGLQTIFAIFLGLMVAAFVGIGVNTFYPSPYEESNKQMRELSRREQAITGGRPYTELSAGDRERLRRVQQERENLQEAQQDAYEVWQKRTSIILISFATLVMAISLVRADQLPVVSNGLLLGGVFTMLYGVAWIVMAGVSRTRFVVMTFALVITLALGYVRFVRRQRVSSAAPAVAGVGGGELIQFDERLRVIERRLDQAASALGRRD